MIDDVNIQHHTYLIVRIDDENERDARTHRDSDKIEFLIIIL